MRLAYADPPYPGKAHLYPENTEVDHAELIAQLCEYDGWALSTDETALSYVLALCPPGVRVLAWCKPDAVPFLPNPIRSWEPVLCQPARTKKATVRSYFVAPAPPRGFIHSSLVGAKPEGFCEWVIRCLGAEPDDSLTDVFPGTDVMGRVWERFQRQPPLFAMETLSHIGKLQITRRTHPLLPGFDAAAPIPERKPAA